MELGAEPAHDAAGFFGGAFGVEGDEAFEQDLFCFFLLGGLSAAGGEAAGFADESWCKVGPAVGVEDGGVELIVEFSEDSHQALFVDLFVFVG